MKVQLKCVQINQVSFVSPDGEKGFNKFAVFEGKTGFVKMDLPKEELEKLHLLGEYEFDITYTLGSSIQLPPQASTKFGKGLC